MIAEPFLLNEDCSAFVDNDTEAMRAAAAELQRLIAPSGRRTVALNDTNLPADSLAEAQQMTRVRYAFWIMAAVQVIAKFHYTDPTGPARTFLRRNSAGSVRVSDIVRAGPFRSARVRSGPVGPV